MRASSVVALTIWIGSLLFLDTTAVVKGEQADCPPPYIRKISPQLARPGEQVKIRGWGFGTKEGKIAFSYKKKKRKENPDALQMAEEVLQEVLKQEEKAKVVQWTHMMIIVVVPKTAINGPVTVSLPCGSVSNEYPFFVIEVRDTESTSPPT